ncbi:MAG: class I SAM-dependent methyltransferase [Chloroflexi bacterium]|nr:class I SAM-dependent methyltransferase [Chloroflexota bacterium]
MWIAIAALIVLLIGILFWWLFSRTEGVYLGRQVVIWLYDRYASRYDKAKTTHMALEVSYLSHPLRQALADRPAPMVLDVATGTGRLPLVLLRTSKFRGTVVGIDLSQAMLGIAAEKLAAEIDVNRLYLMHAPAEALPFTDGSFDAVTCLEALEFMSSPRRVLTEIVRVARPGAMIILSNRQGLDALLMPGKVMSHQRLRSLLESRFGLRVFAIDESWSELYALVWAKKPGTSSGTSTGTHLSNIWRCPRCQRTELKPSDDHWTCANCRQRVIRQQNRVIAYFQAQSSQKSGGN